MTSNTISVYCIAFVQSVCISLCHTLVRSTRTMSRFQQITENGLLQLQVQQNAPNTERCTKFGVKLLHTYLSECGIPEDFVTIEVERLSPLLERFYAAARQEDGSLYKLNSMKSIRSSLQRRYLEKCEVDIVEDNRFIKANTIFSNICKRIKAAGLGDTTHYPEIEPEDVRKLCSSFNIDDPYGLQEKVWFDIQLYLIRRGREGQRAMKKTTFGVFHDATGRRFFEQVIFPGDKNHDINDDSEDTTGEGRLYATGDVRCPVKCFEKYLSHLHPAQDALWQRPLQKMASGQKIWYCNSPVGEKTLGAMLSKMSSKYHLSQRYTNHSIRVTSMQILDDNLIDGRHIQRVSGHKSLDSVQNYGRRLSTSRKRDISSIFSRAAGNFSGDMPVPNQPRPLNNQHVSSLRDHGHQSTTSQTVNYQEAMAINQSTIDHQLNLPNFTPRFSLLPNFDRISTATSNNSSQHHQPIYNMGTINYNYHYNTSPPSPPRGKRLRLISDSDDEE